jgi:hypothetical protein
MPQSGVTASRRSAQREQDWLYETSPPRPVRAASQPRPVRAAGSHLAVVEAPPSGIADPSRARAATAAPRARATTADPRPRPATATDAPRPRATSRPAQAPQPTGGVPGRRTITITGQGAERYAAQTRRRPSQRAYERPGFRPDRAALWAVLLGVLLILVAASSSHAAVHHAISVGHALISTR